MFNFKKHGMKKNYVTTAVALLFLAGCSNDIKETDIQFTGDTGAKVSFSAVINNHEASNLVTRATERFRSSRHHPRQPCEVRQA